MPRSFFGVEEFFGMNWNIVSGRHRFSRTMQHVNVKLMNIHNLVHRLLFIDEGLTSCVSTALYSAGQQTYTYLCHCGGACGPATWSVRMGMP